MTTETKDECCGNVPSAEFVWRLFREFSEVFTIEMGVMIEKKDFIIGW